MCRRGAFWRALGFSDEGRFVKKLKIGVLGCSAFAARAMIPALRETGGFELRAVASRSSEKAGDYARRFGCAPVCGYSTLLEREDLDCVYIPLPTGLHSEWVGRAVNSGKHVLVEKSFALNGGEAAGMLQEARKANVLVLENFLFLHHSQTKWVQEQIAAGAVGELRLFRSNFSFPPLPPDNFRYNKQLGGGSLLDVGAYVVKAAQLFLGPALRLVSSTLKLGTESGVDREGTATFIGKGGVVAQLAFGFDSFYQCNWEFVGSKGKITVERAYTPPPTLQPNVHIETQSCRQTFVLPADNHYRNMLVYFQNAIGRPQSYEAELQELQQQSCCLSMVRENAIIL
jgi:dTDP-3,4-didehydro-2,6-dideoxy-alpha-D-glucose 3-reductase